MNRSKMALSPLGMDTSKKKTVLYHTGTNERVWYLNSTVKGTLLHYYHINFVVNSPDRILDNT